MQKDVKEYLREFAERNRKIKSMQLHLDALRDLAKRGTTSHLSDMPKSGSMEKSTIESIVCQIVELEKELDEQQSKLKDEQVKLLGFISRIVQTDEQTVLISRYIYLKAWKVIAEELVCSKCWVFHLHGNALESLRRIIATEDVA